MAEQGVRLPSGRVVPLTNVPQDITKDELKAILVRNNMATEEDFETPAIDPDTFRTDINTELREQGLPEDLTPDEIGSRLAVSGASKVGRLGSGLVKAGAGVAQLGAEIPDVLLGTDLSGDMRDLELERERKFNVKDAKIRKKYGLDDPDIVDQLMEGVGEFSVGGALGVSKRLNVLTRWLDNMVRQGVGGAIEFNETDTTSQRASNTLMSIAFGQAADVGIEAGSFLKNIMRPEGSRSSFINSDLLKQEESQKVLKAAQDLGIIVTPGEASGDILLRAGEQSLTLNKTGKKELSDFLKSREAEIIDELKGIRDSMFIGGNKDEHTRLSMDAWDRAANTTIDIDKLRKLRENPVWDDVLKNLQSKNTEAIDFDIKERIGLPNDWALPPNSIAWLDVIKRDGFDDLINKTVSDATGVVKNPGDNARLTKARKEFTELLKEEVPEYAEYLTLQQRKIGADKMTEALEGAAESKKNAPASHFFKTLLDKPHKRDDLLNTMGDIPGAKEKIQALTTVLGKLEKSGLQGMMNQEIRARFATVGAGPLGTLGINVAQQTSGEFNRAIIEYITNPRWVDDIGMIGKIGNKTAQAKAFTKYMAGIAAYREERSRRFGEAELKKEASEEAIKAQQSELRDNPLQ